MKKFHVFLLVAFALPAMPSVCGACDGLFGRVAGKLEGRVIGFGLIRNATKTGKYAAPKVYVPPVKAKTPHCEECENAKPMPKKS